MSIDSNAFNQFVSSVNQDIARLNIQLEESLKRIGSLEEQNSYLRNTIVRLVAERKGIQYEDIDKVVVSEDGTLNLIVKMKEEADTLNIPLRENPYA